MGLAGSKLLHESASGPEKQRESRKAIWPCDAQPWKTSHETRFVLNGHLAKLLETKDDLWWAHQGSNLGPAD
jgi:hypothetical protein